MASWEFFAFWESFLSKWVFLLHVPLHIKLVILMLAKPSFGWALFAGTQNNHKPIMGYFGHRSGRLLKNIISAKVRAHPPQTRARNECFWPSCNAIKGRRPCASLSWLAWPVTWITLSWQITRMTWKPYFVGRWRYTILITHFQHKTIYFF